MRLHNKVALVTGSATGIGRGIALEFAREGATVVINYLDEEDRANALVEELTSLGREVLAWRADVSRRASREALFSGVAARFGKLDVLVNNAGVDPGDIPFLALEEEQYEAIASVNIRATLFCAQAAAQLMVERGIPGRIINISSVRSRLTTPGRTAYSASKGAVDAMTRAMALDLAPYAITVNAIAPGFIEVERTVRARDTAARTIPARRVGFPSDVGALAVFLASAEASFLTGQIIGCDGGSSVKLDIDD